MAGQPALAAQSAGERVSSDDRLSTVHVGAGIIHRSRVSIVQFHLRSLRHALPCGLRLNERDQDYSFPSLRNQSIVCRMPSLNVTRGLYPSSRRAFSMLKSRLSPRNLKRAFDSSGASFLPSQR